MSRFALLFADPRLLKFGNSFKARETTVSSGQIMIGLAGLAIAITILWFVSRAMERRARRGHFDSSWGLFLSLGKAHNLSWPQRWLLWQLARCHQLEEPARLFLEPERFDPKNLSDALRAKEDRLKLIFLRIFTQKTVSRKKTDTRSKTPKKSPAPVPAPVPEPPSLVSFPIDESPTLELPPRAIDLDHQDGPSTDA